MTPRSSPSGLLEIYKSTPPAIKFIFQVTSQFGPSSRRAPFHGSVLGSARKSRFAPFRSVGCSSSTAPDWFCDF